MCYKHVCPSPPAEEKIVNPPRRRKNTNGGATKSNEVYRGTGSVLYECGWHAKVCPSDRRLMFLFMQYCFPSLWSIRTQARHYGGHQTTATLILPPPPGFLGRYWPTAIYSVLHSPQTGAAFADQPSTNIGPQIGTHVFRTLFHKYTDCG